VRLSPVILDSTLFLCRNRRQESGELRPVPVATGFLVSFPIKDNPPADVYYVVTARHVVEDDRVAPIFVRANKADGTSAYYSTAGLEWFVHDAADVAVHLLTFDDALAVRCLAPRRFVVGPDYSFQTTIRAHNGQVVTHKERILTGDEVAVVGLFVQDFGTTVNLPIARFGHIARMPSVVHTPRWRGDTHRSPAYLVECTSWAGMSGSPVFWFQKVYHSIQDGATAKTREQMIPALVGLISGHVNRKSEWQVEREDKTETITADLNTGVAVVTPSTALFELLTSEGVSAERREIASASGFQEPYATLDIAHCGANQEPPLPPD